MAGTGSRRQNGDSSRSTTARDDNSNDSTIPSNPSTGGGGFIPQTQNEEDDQIQPVLDTNETLEIRRLVGSCLEQLTESSKYDLWYARLINYLRQFKLDRHVTRRIDPTPGDEDSQTLCMSATSIVTSAISSSLMETMQRKYNTDPLGNALFWSQMLKRPSLKSISSVGPNYTVP